MAGRLAGRTAYTHGKPSRSPEKTWRPANGYIVLEIYVVLEIKIRGASRPKPKPILGH